MTSLNSTQLWTAAPLANLSANLSATFSNDLRRYLIDRDSSSFFRTSYFTMGLFGLFGNMFVLSVICLNRSRNPNVTENLLRHQAVADLVTSLFVVMMALFPPTVSISQTAFSRQTLLCISTVVQALTSTSFCASLYNLVALTAVQYFEIVHPLFNRTHLLNISVPKIICLEWTLSISLRFTYIFFITGLAEGNCASYSSFTTSLQSVFVGVTTLLLNFVLPVALMTYCLCRMAWTMHKKAVQVMPATGTGVLPIFANAKINIIKTLIMFLLIIIICWLSAYLEYALAIIGVIDMMFFSSWTYRISVSFLYLSCSINPFVYAVKYKKFRDGIKKLLRKVGSR